MAYEDESGKVYKTEREWEKERRHVNRRSKLRLHRRYKTRYGYVECDFWPEEGTRPWTALQIERAEAKKAANIKRGRAKAKRTREENERDRLRSEGAGGARIRTMAEALRCRVGDIAGDDGRVRYDVLCAHTAWQWCSMGFVPRPDADWFRGHARKGQSEDYYYCEWPDVRYDKARADMLLVTGPKEVDRLPDGRPYYGKPWWGQGRR